MLSFLFPVFGKYAADNIKSAVERAKLQALCSALIGGAVLCAMLCLCLALFFFLWEFMSPVKAAALLAVIWLLVAFIGTLCLRLSLERRKREQRAQGLMSAENAKLFTGTALSLAPALIGGVIGGKSWRRLFLLALAAAGGAAAYKGLRRRDKK